MILKVKHTIDIESGKAIDGVLGPPTLVTELVDSESARYFSCSTRS